MFLLHVHCESDSLETAARGRVEAPAQGSLQGKMGPLVFSEAAALAEADAVCAIKWRGAGEDKY